MASYFYCPPCFCIGEMVENWQAGGTDMNEGIIEMKEENMMFEPLTSPKSMSKSSPVLLWRDAPPSRDFTFAKNIKKRDRQLLELIVENPGITPASLSVSIPSTANPCFLSTSTRQCAPLPLGSLRRDVLPRDATPSLPASLGPTITFATISAKIPPETMARVCQCCENADDEDPHL